MIDKSRPEPAAHRTLPAFTPVPRLSRRHDGWTADRQRGFIEALAVTGSVTAAARAVGMTPESAYLLRRHGEAGEFAAAWEAALACGVERLEDIAMERAIHGVEVPVYCCGNIVGTRTVHNDRLLMFLLRNRAGERFTAGARHDALTRQELKKLKAQWIEEWKEENGHNRSAADVRAAIDRKVAEIRDRVEAVMSEETRELHRAYQASLERDRADPSRRERPALPAPESPLPGGEG